MQEYTIKIINKLKLKELDEMGYELNENAQYHHIIKKEHGGKTTENNGAVLNPSAHQYLHIIEKKDKPTYNAINGILKIISLRGSITNRDYELINGLLNDFEMKFYNTTNAKGKPLIRQKYLERKKS